MRFQRLTGTYLLSLEPLIVEERGEELLLSGPGVPLEFAARIVPSGPGLRVAGGPLDGAAIVFTEGDPSPGGVLAGTFEFTRASAETSLPGGRGLLAPALELSEREVTRYRELLDAIEHEPDGDWLALDERPRWRFVEWLTQQDRVIFHGSPRADIEVFRPVRTSVELMDHAGTGNLAAVYGTSHGLWAMWFAVLERSRLRGSIRNGVLRWTDPSASALDVYHFSVHHEYVGGDIWHSGTLYLLSRRSFRPNALFPGGPPSAEWASLEAVEPMKRLAVDPGDFPFRERVGGHDDSELIRADELAAVVLDRVQSARRTSRGLELRLDWDGTLAAVLEDYLPLATRFTPDTERRLTRVNGRTALLEVSGPAGVLQALENSLDRRGVRTSDPQGDDASR